MPLKPVHYCWMVLGMEFLWGIILEMLPFQQICPGSMQLHFGIFKQRARGYQRLNILVARVVDVPCLTFRKRRRRIRAVTHHLKGVKIAIMGCIVNGPG